LKRTLVPLQAAALLVAAALVLTASAASANDDELPLFSGLIGIDFGLERQDTGVPGTHSDTAFAYGGDGRVSVPIHESRWTLQGDLSTFQTEQGQSNATTGASTVGLHLSYRTPQFLVGGFGAFAKTEQNGNSNGGEGSIVGLEGQAYVGDLLTLYGQVGWADHSSDVSGFRDGWFANLEKRWFFGPDCGLTTGFGYAATGNARFGGNDLEVWSWEARAFTRISKRLPIYATLGYEGAQYDLDNPNADEGESHRVAAGFQFLFGADGTALENDRRGATLSTPIETTLAAGWPVRF